MTPLRPLMQTNVKPPSPLRAPEQQALKPMTPLGGVWVFRTVCFERVVLSSPGCLWPGRMDDHEEVLEAHA